MKTKFMKLNVKVLCLGLIVIGLLTQCKMSNTEKETFEGYKITLKDIDPSGKKDTFFVFKEFFEGKDADYFSHIGQDYSGIKYFKSCSVGNDRVSFEEAFAFLKRTAVWFEDNDSSRPYPYTDTSFQHTRLFVDGEFYEYSPNVIGETDKDGTPLENMENKTVVEVLYPWDMEMSFNMKCVKSFELVFGSEETETIKGLLHNMRSHPSTPIEKVKVII